MAWLILITVCYGGTDRIDVTADIHIGVNYAKWTDMTQENRFGKNGLTRLKKLDLKKNW
jgi:hypothetical protein